MSNLGRTLTPVQAVKYVIKPLLTALAHLHSCNFIHRDIKPENLLMHTDNTVMLCDFDLAIDASAERPCSPVLSVLAVQLCAMTSCTSACLHQLALHCSHACTELLQRSQVRTICMPGLVSDVSCSCKLYHCIQVGTPDYVAPEVLLCKARRRPDGSLAPSGASGYTAAVDIWAVGILAWEVLAGKAPFAAKTIDEIKSNVKEGKCAAMPAWSAACQDFVGQCLTREASKRPSAGALLQHPWVLNPR